MTRKDTKLTEAGRRKKDPAGAVNTPIYRASTFLFPDVETMLKGSQEYVYGRRGTPTTRALEDAICEIEGGAASVLAPSGLAACTLAILAVCGAGDHILVADSVYGPTRIFCDKEAKRFGIETTYYDPLAGENIAKLFKPNTKAVFCESPGSYTFEVQDIPAIAAAAHKKNIAVLMDNTWATPHYFNAIGHGVDLSIQAATKYIGGHADISVGTITANEAYKDRLLAFQGHAGIAISGDEAFLAMRGLRTLSVRLARHHETATLLGHWLRGRPEVARVLYPPLPGDPGHTLWRRDFSGGTGLFGVELKPAPEKAVRAMIDGMKLFGIGYSWGGFESLILPAHFSRTVDKAEHGPLIRIHAGLEDIDDLRADLIAGFERLHQAV